MSQFDNSVNLNTNIAEKICSDLREKGYCVIKNALPKNIVSQLTNNIHELDKSAFHRASIGRNTDKDQDDDVRQDHIYWIDGSDTAGQLWLDWANSLKDFLNRRLFLGLFSFESHYAVYDAGEFYLKHVDAFRGQKNRTLSLVTYLNEDWTNEQGGELLIYDENDHDTVVARVTPAAGTLVIFLSESFPHEVLPATKPRMSIAGWFRVNTSVDGKIDPAR